MERDRTGSLSCLCCRAPFNETGSIPLKSWFLSNKYEIGDLNIKYYVRMQSCYRYFFVHLGWADEYSCGWLLSCVFHGILLPLGSIPKELVLKLLSYLSWMYACFPQVWSLRRWGSSWIFTCSTSGITNWVVRSPYGIISQSKNYGQVEPRLVDCVTYKLFLADNNENRVWRDIINVGNRSFIYVWGILFYISNSINVPDGYYFLMSVDDLASPDV